MATTTQDQREANLIRIDEIIARKRGEDAGTQGGIAFPAGVEAVRQIMADGLWHTIAELADRTGFKATGVSARIRDLRKKQYGPHTIERPPTKDRSVYAYRLVNP